ncbi:sorting and assembly machinery component 50 homolog isoform X2 [Fopius arisanus]|uniref:Samm50_0 protein n=2 Tax=Fopius arisanus TaxID=64838 RepID=A0A0C9S157_9HYME|nr:PREDICTED: sorting and assembly machinery component 50 homolog isoform X2 [Fopius arisanus]
MGTVYAKEPSETKDYGGFSSNPFSSNSSYEQSWSPGVSAPPPPEQPYAIDLHQRARVDKVHIDGLKRTKDDIIKAQINELFKAKDFYDVIENVQRVKSKLETLGCFNSIGVSIDTSKGPDATPEGVEVTFNVKEMKRLSGGVSTMVGNNEGSLLIQAKAPNILGRGERLQMEYSYGTKSTSNINVSAVKPFVDDWLHKVLTTSVYNSTTDVPWSGYKEKDHGLLIDLGITPGLLKHNFQYETSYRDIIPAKSASFHVREQCGPSLKSALRHICSIDKRDDKVFPSSGSLVQFTTELAGLGGDIGFMKYGFTLQSNYTPFEFISLQLGAQAGFLRGISNDMQINIADKFFLGGPMNVRGFAMRGCGPRNDGNAIGGNTFWALALHLYTPLPFRPGKNSFGELFRLHGFINGGNLGNITLQKDGDYSQNLRLFTDNVRWSTGAGIAMRIGGIARIELNLIYPLSLTRLDIFQQYQFGIGLHYL